MEKKTPVTVDAIVKWRLPRQGSPAECLVVYADVVLASVHYSFRRCSCCGRTKVLCDSPKWSDGAVGAVRVAFEAILGAARKIGAVAVFSPVSFRRDDVVVQDALRSLGFRAWTASKQPKGNRNAVPRDARGSGHGSLSGMVFVWSEDGDHGSDEPALIGSGDGGWRAS